MSISQSSYKKVEISWWILKVAYGLLFILAGLDKVFNLNLIVFWQKYVSEYVISILPVGLKVFMLGVGIFETFLGCLILFLGWTQLGAYIAFIWLILISLNLAWTGIYYDIAVRDTIMALGAFALALLTNVVQDERS